MIAYNIHVYQDKDIAGEAKDVKELKAIVKAALLAFNKHAYPSAFVKFEGKEAMCTLTPKKQLRFEEREVYVQPVKPVYGEFVKIISVHGKYDESMGAYEVLTVEDSNGQQFSVGSMYDQSTCFRIMTDDAKLQYAQKAV